jgi:myo-inositol-1(or 4)-monophosphatase
MDRKEVLVKALRAAGEAVLEHDPASVETTSKLNSGDLLTAADLASEKAIIGIIQSAFPDDRIISEEIPESFIDLSEDNLESVTAWVIDPIDGTSNFKHDMAYSCISIGYVEKGVPVLGGILDPFRDQLYLAEKGKGATLNGKPIHVSDVESFSPGTRVCTSNNLENGGTYENLAKLNKLGDVWVDVLGSAVHIIVDVAAGRLDLYFHTWLKPWDNAAGFLIAQEAGAKIVGLSGQPVTWLTAEVVMGNPGLVDEFIKRQLVLK